MTDTQQLITLLAARATPVRPLASPLRRTFNWVAIVVVVMAFVVLLLGVRPGVVDAMSEPTAIMEWIAPAMTGLLAGYAVFEISVPGRSPRWAWLPVPALVLWLGSIGFGCLDEWTRMGSEAFAFDTHGLTCLATITLISLPLVLVMLLMVRHAAVVRPVATAMLGSLSAAALSTAGVSLTHGGESALTVLLWHVGAVSLLGLTAAAFSRQLFAWMGYERIN